MTRDDIIRWAEEAGHPYPQADEQFLADYANLVIEMCAKVCDEQHDRARTSTGAARADACAAAIRAKKDSA